MERSGRRGGGLRDKVEKQGEVRGSGGRSCRGEGNREKGGREGRSKGSDANLSIRNSASGVRGQATLPPRMGSFGIDQEQL